MEGTGTLTGTSDAEAGLDSCRLDAFEDVTPDVVGMTETRAVLFAFVTGDATGFACGAIAEAGAAAGVDAAAVGAAVVGVALEDVWPPADGSLAGAWAGAGVAWAALACAAS